MLPISIFQCVSPYVGDGVECVLDSDGDLYPDLALRTCSSSDEATYCSMDTCPFAPNPIQEDKTPCEGDETGIYTKLHYICTHTDTIHINIAACS